MQALKTAEANKGVIKADSLQQLHAMHNLAALVGPGTVRPPGVVPTLRDEQLQRDANAIREVGSSRDDYKPCWRYLSISHKAGSTYASHACFSNIWSVNELLQARMQFCTGDSLTYPVCFHALKGGKMRYQLTCFVVQTQSCNAGTFSR